MLKALLLPVIAYMIFLNFSLYFELSQLFMMRVLLVVVVLFACGNANILLGRPYRWWTDYCLLGPWKNNPFTSMLCTFYYPTQKKQCDFKGTCWCVSSKNSDPIPPGQYHRYNAVDCVKTIESCPRTMTFQYCSDCMHSCTDKLHRFSCSNNCSPGCNCPPNTFWNDVECVPIEMCPSIDNNLPDSNTNSENNNLNEQSRVDMEIISTMVQTTVETFTRTNRPSTVSTSSATTTTSSATSASTISRILQATTGSIPVDVTTPECDANLNEIFLTCASPCDLTCEGSVRNCSLPESCTSRCACPNGQRRNEDNVCIPISQCPARDETFLNECHRRAREFSSEYLTQCDEDGFFKTKQCAEDECFCVDKFSGEELHGTRAHKSAFDLKCSFLGDCPAHMKYSHCATTCPPTCSNPTPRCSKNCATDCYCDEGFVRINDTSTVCIPINDCPVSENSCAYLRDTTSEGRRLQCDDKGGFKPVQCGGGQCWCVDEMGEEIANTRNSNIIKETVCFAARSCRSKSGMDFSLCAPPCDNTCEEQSRDCHAPSECIARCHCYAGLVYDSSTDNCVSPDNCPPPVPSCRDDLNEIFSSCASICDPTCDEPDRNCSLTSTCSSGCSCPPNTLRNRENVCVSIVECPTETQRNIQSECQERRSRAISDSFLDAFIPDCDDDGLFESKQCYGFLLECWCVDKSTGRELHGSRSPQYNPDFNIDCSSYIEPENELEEGSESFSQVV